MEVIERLPPPTYVKGVRSFLRHAGFYHRCIKDFCKTTKPLTLLLAKDTSFLTNECLEAFHKIKKVLITTPFIQPPDWNIPFKITCDASDHAIRVVLG